MLLQPTQLTSYLLTCFYLLLFSAISLYIQLCILPFFPISLFLILLQTTTKMAVMRSRHALLLTALAALLSHTFVVSTASYDFFEDQKNYYTPDPNAQPPPAVTYSPPPYSSGGGHASPTPPSHGGGSTPRTPSHGTPPSHGSDPSHGTPSHGGSPPANCGNPPSGGGGHHTSPPSGGGYYGSPPPSTPTPTTPYTPTPTTPTPTTPIDPGTPTTPYTPTPTTPTTPYTPTPTTPIDPGTPTTPYTPTPTTPIDPGTPTIPGIGAPSPPFPFDPNSPPFTCTYWRNHPTLIWGLFGWLGSVGNAFGPTSGTGGSTPPISGANMNLLQALSNTRTDGIGALYREGTAALLNSMAHTRFPYTTNQVRESFVRSLGSNRAAAAQAQLFKMANEGRMRPRD